MKKIILGILIAGILVFLALFAYNYAAPDQNGGEAIATRTPEPPVETPPPPVDNPPKNEPNDATVDRFFPVLPDTLWRYEGNNVTFAATNNVFFGYINGSRAQRRVAAGNIATTEILDTSGGKIELIHGDSMYYYYDDITYTEPSMSFVILKEPLTLGAKWTATEGAQSEITAVNEPVSVAAGDFKTIEVTTTYSNGFTDKYYYAQDTGLVKSVCDSNGGPVISELAEIIKDPNELDFVLADIYWPNTTENTVQSIGRKFFLKTNDNFAGQFEKAMKNPPALDFMPILTPNAKIDELTIDWASKTAHIDISEDYLKEINVGDGLQIKILQCIANTIGNFYGVDEVLLTIDGKPYGNGATTFEQGETLTVEKPSLEVEQ